MGDYAGCIISFILAVGVVLFVRRHFGKTFGPESPGRCRSCPYARECLKKENIDKDN